MSPWPARAPVRAAGSAPPAASLGRRGGPMSEGGRRSRAGPRARSGECSGRGNRRHAGRGAGFEPGRRASAAGSGGLRRGPGFPPRPFECVGPARLAPTRRRHAAVPVRHSTWVEYASCYCARLFRKRLNKLTMELRAHKDDSRDYREPKLNSRFQDAKRHNSS